MQGIIVFDWKDRYGEALKELGGYVAAGKLKYARMGARRPGKRAAGFIGLLKGENFGKQLVKLA